MNLPVCHFLNNLLIVWNFGRSPHHAAAKIKADIVLGLLDEKQKEKKKNTFDRTISEDSFT